MNVGLVRTAELQLSIGSETIPFVESFKDLGVTRFAIYATSMVSYIKFVSSLYCADVF